MHYAVIDIGSPKQGNLGWWVTGPFIEDGGTAPEQMIAALSEAVRAGPVVLGFEAPMYVPAKRNIRATIQQRPGKAGRPWSAGAGASVPDAIFTTVGKQFSGKVTPTSGAFPLPTIEEFQTVITDLGVEPDTRVIVYSPNPAVAARAWWVFRWSGFDNVLLLDGGLKAFVDAGGETASPEALNVPIATEKPAIVSADHLKTLGYDEIPEFVRIGILIDARAPEAFGTEESPTHIPGAQNAPSTQVWDADGRLRADEELRSFFKAFIGSGEKPVAASCGGGVMGAYAVLALKAIGVDAPLYVGSYSEWSKRQAAAKVEGSAQ